MNQRPHHAGAHASTARTAYEASVIHRAMERAGSNPQLKGHLHEVLVQDRLNLRNLLAGDGARTAMTRSTNAPVVDLVTTRGGKVIERLQLKDTVSASAVDKVVKQVASGKYDSARLIGTEETTELVNRGLEKAGVAKRMTSSGISSESTTALAQRAGATGSGTLAGATLQAARSGGATGAWIGAGVETVRGISDLIDGRRDAGEVLVSVAGAGAKGYATGAAASAAATAGGAVLASGLTAVGVGAGAAAVAAPLAVAVTVGWAVSSLWDSIFG